MTFNPPTYLLHVVQCAGGVGSFPPHGSMAFGAASTPCCPASIPGQGWRPPSRKSRGLLSGRGSLMPDFPYAEGLCDALGVSQCQSTAKGCKRTQVKKSQDETILPTVAEQACLCCSPDFRCDEPSLSWMPSSMGCQIHLWSVYRSYACAQWQHPACCSLS